MTESLASIDIGTNSVLLLIARPKGNNLEVLSDEARISRLGEGLHKNPDFSAAAEARTVAVLKEYKDRCDRLALI